MMEVKQTPSTGLRHHSSTTAVFSYAISPFLTGRMFVREPSWKYSAKLGGS